MKTSAFVKYLLLLALVLLPAGAISLAQQGPEPDEAATDAELLEQPVEVRLEIFLVSEVQGEEQFVPATTARPGQVVEYRLTAVNRGPVTLPQGTVEIIGPVPPQTTYITNSATPTSERLLTEYSIDGGDTFSAEPVLVGEGEDRRVAESDEYNAIRWTLLVPMEPGQEEAFFYRVTVN